jgi:hypothetical protein
MRKCGIENEEGNSIAGGWVWERVSETRGVWEPIILELGWKIALVVKDARKFKGEFRDLTAG